ncbi:MAG: polysaccharide biosynthesis protein [Acidobacteriota bacterium]|nr:polysaccharide biosynthesis protein [Acidobacteriota bacterium]
MRATPFPHLFRPVVRIRFRLGRVLRPWLIHRRTQCAIDACASGAAVLIAYLLRFDGSVPAANRAPMFTWMTILFLVHPTVIISTRGYKATWQHFGLRDIRSLLLRVGPVAIALLATRAILRSREAMPYTVVLIWWGVVLALSSAVRIARRVDHEAILRATRGPKRALLVGTQGTLSGALRQLQTDGSAALVGLVLDDLHGMRVSGVLVLGGTANLRDLVLKHEVEIIFVSSAELDSIPYVAEVCSELGISLRFLPSVRDVTNDYVRVSRNVTLGSVRPEAFCEPEQLHPDVVNQLNDRVILITGAGGSIGSEIARQISRVPYRELLLLDKDESSIFELLNEIGHASSIVPIIANIRDRQAIRRIFHTYQPSVVLHAAAYKHVPLMEQNPCEAVLNNVCGTVELAEAASDFNCERFVMISTDKAVRPSSIMGATKRMAEMVVQQQAANSRQRTQFACVRFGNVLGSRGSVLPVFLRQIAEGGPLTVTHEEMTRYFMTIPQAVRLVLQAATLASTGDVYMLDMGDPVRIMDFARQVVQSAGLVPGKDIQIEIVGTRPGEKLHEQLWNEDAEISATAFPQVFRVHATEVEPHFSAALKDLTTAARERRDVDLLGLLREMPVDYRSERAHKHAEVPTLC